MKKFNLAIVGASGLVGKTIIKILGEEGLLSKFDITLYVSDKSAGKVLIFKDFAKELIKLDETAKSKHFDIVLMSAGDDISYEYAESFARNGAYVIDNSNAFRRYKNVPLVVPEINVSEIKPETKIISNPNCSTIQLAVVIDKLLKLSDIKKIVVSTYQSVSGAGSEALLDLENGTNHVITEGIKDNVVAYIGNFQKNGFCTEEDKMMFETNKILSKNISLCATTVRVPVPYCHSESIFVEFENEVQAKNVEEILKCDYISVSSRKVFSLDECADSNLTYVCRIRNFSEKEVSLFIVADNLRRGAAYNAVMIAKHLIDKGYIKNH